ncbi:hypothetical protein OIDMADRAFT_127322 [Oidiodendron maius Zn]|uniref:Major facilitator superfamily (MFS) profile domain-containing protein n=1 Tax=Oidiodendron maius (strain Zn) TaxID=913774 RepID=A0A0C3DBL1_OIDMZ|nr:hypothetical protein OIDMADRAFT_127322 [Oidiodendron maius Zn]
MASFIDKEASPSRPNQAAEVPSSRTTPETIGVEKAEAPSNTSAWGDDAPDGGSTAWLCVLGAWCTMFCSFGWINSIGTFQEYYQINLLKQYSPSEISWIPSLQIFIMFATGPIVGKIYDQRGPHILLLVGTFLHVFGLMMASISSRYYQVLLSQGVCSACGVACIFQPALSATSGWFNKKRGAAFGALSTGSSLGGVIFPIMVSRLIREVGYGWAMRISAFLILFLLIVANLAVKSRLPPRSRSQTKQEPMRPFKETSMMLLLGGAFFLTFGIFIPINFIIVEAIAQGMAPGLAQYLLAVLNATSLFGRALSGMLADKVGRYNVFVVVCYTTSILILALWIPATNNAATIAFAGFFGFTSGAYVSLLPALAAQISPPREIGFRTGLLFLFCSLGGLTTSPIAGAILARENGDYLGMKIFAGVMVLIGTTGVLFAKLAQSGWKLTAKF